MATSAGGRMNALAGLAGSPAPDSEPTAAASPLSSAMQLPDARPHDPRWRPWLEPPRVRNLLCRVAERLARRSRHAAAFARQAEQRRAKFAGPAVLLSAFLPVPSPLIYAAAGWAGLRLVPFIILDLIGSAVWAALLAVLGYLMGSSGVAAANLVSHYAIASVTGLTAIAIAPHAWHALRSRQASWARSRARQQRGRHHSQFPSQPPS